eukprot:10876525-Karenia_brevis.AAC.1
MKRHTSQRVAVVTKRKSLARQATVDAAAIPGLVDQQRSEPPNASSYHDGTLLGGLAQGHLETFAKVMTRNHVGLHGEQTFGSMCSGSEGVHFVLEAISRSWAKGITATGQESSTASGQAL